MKNKHISLGKIIGIPIDLDYSWFLILALLTWMLAQSYFPQEFKNWPVYMYWVISLFTSVIFFISILLHELGHSIVARKYKIKVKRITLFVFGGVAEIASEPPKSLAEFLIAIAGPITSFLLAAIFYLLQHLSAGNNYLAAPFHYLAFINFILAVFNLIPGFPLDGGRVFRAIVWGFTKNLKKATTIAANVGRFFGFLFIMIGVIQIFQNNFIDGIWIAFIGWFLESAAASQIQRQALDELLTGHKVDEAMSVDYGIVYPDSVISEIIDNHFIGANRRSLFVKEGDKIVGFITPAQVNSVPQNQRDNKTVGEIMIPAAQMSGVKSDQMLLEALKTIEQSEFHEVLVIEDDKYVGILNQASIFKFIFDLHKLGH